MPALSNIPLQLASFVGREREIAEVRRLLDSSRLLTLTGPGGAGKTRLALRVASQVAGEYRDGVYFVNLSPITDPGLVAPTIGQALNVKDMTSRPLVEALLAYLQDKEILLLLDNFEQVSSAAPVVVDMLLSALDVKVLVTSREPLHVAGEQQFLVPPLALPPIDVSGSAPALAADQPVSRLAEYEAVELFTARARAVRSDFELTSENALAVAQICHRLDGLPLALELAAARIRFLSPQAILERLDRRLRLLTGGAVDLPARHRTLSAAIEWSYDLLTAPEKKLFRRLAVFQGRRTLDALEAVCNYDGSLELDMLDGITALVDKNLVGYGEGAGGESFYWLLETIHEYARERIEESGEAEELRWRHLAYFTSFAEQAEVELKGPRQKEWLLRLEGVHNNLRSALEWSLQSSEGEAQHWSKVDLGLRLAGALCRFWYRRGYLNEGRMWANAAISAANERPVKPPLALRAKVLGGAGLLAWRQADYAEARALHEECLALYREAKDRAGIAEALNNLGMVAWRQADYDAAQRMCRQSQALFREEGDRHGFAKSLTNQAIIAFDKGDVASAFLLYQEALGIVRELQDKISIAHLSNNIGIAAFDQGNIELARSMHEESLATYRELGDLPGIATVLSSLGKIARLGAGSESTGKAREYYEEALALSRKMSDKHNIASALKNLGELAYVQGDFETARGLLGESLDLRHQMGDRQAIAQILAALGDVAASEGDFERAVRLLSAAAALAAAIGSPFSDAQQSAHTSVLDTAKARLGKTAWDAAHAEGRSMTMEQAVDYARGGLHEVGPARQTAPRSIPARTVVRESGDLSAREAQVLRLAAQGLSNAQIAERLFLSTNTVRAHLYTIYNKLGVSNRTEAIRLATKPGPPGERSHARPSAIT